MLKRFLFVMPIYLFLLAPFPGWTAEPSRGMVVHQVKILDASGKQVGLYRNSHALVIGVSNYTNGWPSLSGVQKDVKEVKAILEKSGFRVRLVMDPTRAELRQAYDDFIQDHGLEPDNRLLFYFAGHGHTIKFPDGREMGYIVPANAPDPNKDERGFMGKAMGMQQIEVYARRIISKHVLFLFDSCFSGSIFALSRAIPTVIQEKTSKPTRQFITAGTANQTVPDESIFRFQFVRGLQGDGDLNRDGYITATELGQFLENTVTNYSKASQTPKYGKIRDPFLDQGDFVFSLNKKSVSPSNSAPLIATSDDTKLDQERREIATARQSLEAERKKIQAERQKLASLPPPSPPAQSKPKSLCPDDMVQVPAGEFVAGYDDGSMDENPEHPVLLESFCMDKYEVTQRAYFKLMRKNPSRFKGAKRPVDSVTWIEARAYCGRIGKRLPTEMEWEKATRAKVGGVYYGTRPGDEEYSWSNQNAGNKPHKVGQKKPSALGLYDMLGNVNEWVSDWYGPDTYKEDPQDNLEGPLEGKHKVLRGGSWLDVPKDLRITKRHAYPPEKRLPTNGFRCALTQ